MITYALLFLATLAHLIIDYHKKETGHPIRHWFSALVTIVLSCIYGFINEKFTQYHWWQFAVYSLAVHFCFFDLLWNWRNDQPWYYHGSPLNPSRAWTDRIYDYIPVYAQPLLRLWVLGVGGGVYYHWDWIVGN